MSSNDDMNPPVPISLVGAHWTGSLMERMGMEVVEHSAQRTVVTMPLEGNRQSVGLLHGGASAALAETAASLAAHAWAHEVGATSAVGVELSVSHLRAARSAPVVATATPVHLGRTSTVHVVDVRDGEGRLVASARVSNRVLGGGGPEAGGGSGGRPGGGSGGGSGGRPSA